VLIVSEYDKPSRQNRRQKRGWQKSPKNQLDQVNWQWQAVPTVLNTPHVAVSAPVSPSGFFASIGFVLVGFVPSWRAQWPGSAQLCNSLRVKAASGLHAVLKYPATPQRVVNSTNHVGGQSWLKQKPKARQSAKLPEFSALLNPSPIQALTAGLSALSHAAGFAGEISLRLLAKSYQITLARCVS